MVVKELELVTSIMEELSYLLAKNGAIGLERTTDGATAKIKPRLAELNLI